MPQVIGIIGGLSPESTVSYYLHLTRRYVSEFGDSSFPEIVIYSVSLEKYHQWRNEDRWDLITGDLVKAGKHLADAGADFALIATNTMHRVFSEVQRELTIPLVNLLDAVAEKIKETENIQRVGLIGTRFTMTDGFYSDHLSQYGIETLIPGEEDREYIHRAIEDELVKGEINESTRNRFVEIIEKLGQAGAQGVILGCTEIPLLVNQELCSIPLFDSALIHADAAYDRIFREG